MEIPNQENIISSLRVCFRGCSIWYLGLFPQPASTTGGIIFKVEDRDQNPHLKLARTGKGFTSQEMWFCLPFVYFTMICRQMHAACKQFKIITTIYAFISTHAYITYLNILNLKTSQCFFCCFLFWVLHLAPGLQMIQSREQLRGARLKGEMIRQLFPTPKRTLPSTEIAGLMSRVY